MLVFSLNLPDAGLCASIMPTISFKSPDTPCVLAGEVSLAVTVTNPENDLTQIQFCFDGPLGNEFIQRSEHTVVSLTGLKSGCHVISCNLQDIPSGQYNYYANACDEKGNRSNTPKLSVRVGPGSHVPNVMIDDDYTHIMNIPNAYNEYISPQTNGHMNIEKLTAAVTHIATNEGLDTYVFCPGLGEVLFYKSDYYSLSKHEKFWERATFLGNVLTKNIPLLHYIREAPEGMGRDPIDDVRDVISNVNPSIKFFVSVRMNDGHIFLRDTDNLFDHDTMQIYTNAYRNLNIYPQLSFFRWLHPDSKIGVFSNLTATGSSIQYLFDYSKNWILTGDDSNGLKRCVYAHKLEIIRDVMKNHKMDGIQLDFMRLPYLFNPDTTTFEQRLNIMTNFICEVRKYADGPYHNAYGFVPQISVRIPFAETEWSRLGIDIQQWALSGVDVFVMSSQRQWYPASYFRDGSSTHDCAPLKVLAGEGVCFISELTYNSEFRNVQINGKNYTQNRRTTDEQLVSGAYLANRQSADGVYLFNFPYYEAVYKDPEVSVGPYRLVKEVGLRVDGKSSNSDIYYYMRSPHVIDFPDAAGGKCMQLPLDVSNSWQTFKFYAPKPGTNSWPSVMRLRVEAADAVDSSSLQAKINGVTVAAIADNQEPFNSPFRYALCNPANTAAFRVPGTVLDGIDGPVNIALRYRAGAKAICWIELTTYSE